MSKEKKDIFTLLIAILGMAVTIVAAVPVYHQWFLEYELVYMVDDVSGFSSDDLPDGISIHVGDKRAEGLHRIFIKVKNIGNKHISPEDFFSPIKFQFVDSRPIFVRVYGDSWLKPTAVIDEMYIVLEPAPLAADEAFYVEVYSEGGMPKIHAFARMKDAKEISEVDYIYAAGGLSVIDFILGIITMLSSAFLLGFLAFRELYRGFNMVVIVSSYLAMTTGAILAAPFLRELFAEAALPVVFFLVVLAAATGFYVKYQQREINGDKNSV